MKKKYTSFEELDQDIKRAYLQSEIDKEEIKLSLYKAKDSITPGKMVASMLGGGTTSSILLKLITPVASFAIGKFLNKYKDK